MDNAEASPAKRSKRPAEKLNATIHFLHDNPDKAAPLVGSYLPKLRGCGYRVYRQSDEPDKVHLVVRQPESNVDLAGYAQPSDRVYRHDKKKPNRPRLVGSPPEPYVDSQYPNLHNSDCLALGVLDKESQTLKIAPVANNHIFNLVLRFGSDFADAELAREEPSAKEKADKVRELNLHDGTKRSVTQDNKMQSLRQEDEPNYQNNLDRKIEEVAINKEAIESTASQTARNIPPYNLSATVPKDAYPIEKIILKGEWDYIRDVLQLLEAGEKVSPDAYPTFVCNRIHKLVETKDEMEKETFGCIFSYINHLIMFKKQHSADRASSAENHNTPSILLQKFLAMFSNTESKRMPSEKIDLLVSYVMVLTLFVDDFWTDPTDIAKDLQMSSVIKQHLENLGCKFSWEENVLYAKLPAPLKFPEEREVSKVDG